MNSGILLDRIRAISCPKCGQRIDTSAVDPLSRIGCPGCGTEIRVPARLGGFLVIDSLGHGGMGAVYRGRDEALGRDVAIKVMTGRLGRDKASVRTLQTEAKAAAALNHPNIVQIYAFDEEKGQPYIVMEYIAGDALDRMIAGGARLDQGRVCRIGMDVAEGLKAASDIGIVHGDVKPQNILLDRNGTAKVVDFGLAKYVEQQTRKEAPGAQGVWGTPYYIAPEKVRGRPGDLRADIYSLGATLYHALAGVPPFEGRTPLEVVKARLEGPPRSLREHRADVHEPLEAVIARMLEADPLKRYPTYTSLLADLRQALRGLPRPPSGGPVLSGKDSTTGKLVVTKTRDRTPAPPPEPAGPRARETREARRPGARRLWVVLGLVAVAAAVTAALLVIRQREQRERRRREEALAQIASLRDAMATNVQLIVAMDTNVAARARQTEPYPEELRQAAERIVEIRLPADTVIVETERLQRKSRLITRMRERAEELRARAAESDSPAAIQRGADELARLADTVRTLADEALESYARAQQAYQEAAALRAARDQDAETPGPDAGAVQPEADRPPAEDAAPAE